MTDTPEQPDAGANGGTDAPDAADPQANGPAAEDGAAPPPSAPEAPTGGDDELSVARDRHLRLAAEFDNYRRRVVRERGEDRQRAQAELVKSLLDVLDDLQRVADFDPETTSSKALHEGAELVERKLLRALETAGLEPVDAEGRAFDPQVHEAITTVPTDSADEDETVADVFQKGYRFQGILLRPARVRVKKHGG